MNMEVEVRKTALTPQARDVLTPEILEIIRAAHLEFDDERQDLLRARKSRQAEFDLGALPQFMDGHPSSSSAWRVAPLPADVLDRRVEITGPVNNTKMVINMLNGTPDGGVADMAMLDFEDSMKPSWENVIDGVHNVIGAIKGTLQYIQPATRNSAEKIYRLNPDRGAHPMVRVRGLHLAEANVTVGGRPVSGGLFDLCLSAGHTARWQLDKNQTPMFYVPKTEHYREARWWHQVFSFVESRLGLPHGSLRTTFLIETLPAAFQMEEILYEIRDRALGLNGGRWDKIFSDIKVLRQHEDKVLADRSSIDMSRPWMENYAKRLIKICHRHGAFAMGGMSAFTPGKDEATRDAQTKKVLDDKAHEASIGHDGCWVSHPYFVGLARRQFKAKNQLDVLLDEFPERPDLLPKSNGPKTLRGLKTNIRVAIAYQNGWNDGIGCISLDNLMEDLATLEISRAQTWQWLRHRVKLEDGREVTPQLVKEIFDSEVRKLQMEFTGDNSGTRWGRAREQAQNLFLSENLPDFFRETNDTV